MPTTDPAADDLPRARELRSALRDVLSNGDAGLFVIIDAARVSTLWALLRELKVEHWCLFRESPKENLKRVAPFLARCETAGDLPLWLSITDPALEAALFVATDAPVNALYNHLRRFLLILDSAGRPNYLRFYDPRVLQPFLAASTEAERRQFFGPIRAFAAYHAPRSESEGKIVLQRWARPETEGPAPPAPSAVHKFQLSPRHEAEFDRDGMERYDRRCAAFLRARYGFKLEGVSDAELGQLINHAKSLGPAIGLASGRDIATVAELLILGFTGEMQGQIANMPAADRSRAVQVLRDYLIQELLGAQSQGVAAG